MFMIPRGETSDMRVTRAISIGAAMLVVLMMQSPLQSQRPSPAPSPQRAAAASTLPRGNAEHGRYLVESVAMCVECHSGRDSQGNIVASERFLGGPIPLTPIWPNWATQAPRNKGLPGYTDDLALRLLTQGSIGRRGEQLRPPMPRFRMNVQDAADVIAYMRSVD
jgi:hypothetical protein